MTNAQSTPLMLYKQFILDTIEGGVTIIQLREKSRNTQQLQQMALELKALLTPLNIPLIINDHLELAYEIGADGIHLGQSDISPIEARKLLGPDKIIGLSIETLAQLDIANQLTCIDYVAASAVFPSQSKSNCKTIWGLSGLQTISQQSTHPVMAIGGINESNIQQVIERGACGAAVISALHSRKDPKKAAHHLITLINHSMENKKNA